MATLFAILMPEGHLNRRAIFGNGFNSSLVCAATHENTSWFGAAEGRDGHDTIEYLAQLEWCNGSVALVGNSWLAIAQWFIAAERPPHLKCIAPWEGASDFYREFFARGGVPSFPFTGFLQAYMYGKLNIYSSFASHV